jgi:hypothetical protein
MCVMHAAAGCCVFNCAEVPQVASHLEVRVINCLHSCGITRCRADRYSWRHQHQLGGAQQRDLWHDSLVLAGSVQPVVAALTSSVTRRCVWRRKQPVHDACVAFMNCVPVVSPGVLQCRVRAAWPSCCHWVPPVPGKLWDRLVCCLQCRD